MVKSIIVELPKNYLTTKLKKTKMEWYNYDKII